MSSSASEADLRARVLHTIRGLRGFFTVTQFRKAYKVRYAEKFSSGNMTTREYLKAFPELSFYEEEDNFSLNKNRVKIEEESSSSEEEDDQETEDAPEEMGETNKDGVEEWYDKKEFQEILKAVKKELKANPDPSVGEEDIPRFVEVHLLRKKILNIVRRLPLYQGDCSFFLVSDLFAEWRSTENVHAPPFYQFGYKSVGPFLESFKEFRRISCRKFSFIDEAAVDTSTKSVAKKIIDEGKKEELKRVHVINLADNRNREVDELRQKVLAMALKVSKRSVGEGLHFCVSDFCSQWKSDYGEALDPQAKFGIYSNLISYLGLIDSLHRSQNDKYVIKRSLRLQFDTGYNGEELPVKAASKKVVKKETLRQQNDPKTSGGIAMDESDEDDITEITDESVLRKRVLAMAMKVGRHSSLIGFHFLVCDFVLEWQNSYGQQAVPFENFGFTSLNSFFNNVSSLSRWKKGKFAILRSYGESSTKANPKQPKKGEEPAELILLRQRVVDVARMVIRSTFSHTLFEGPKFVAEWRRLYGPRPVPCYKFGYKSLTSFLESFDEFRSNRQRSNVATYQFKLSRPDDERKDSDESSSSDEDDLENGSNKGVRRDSDFTKKPSIPLDPKKMIAKVGKKKEASPQSKEKTVIQQEEQDILRAKTQNSEAITRTVPTEHPIANKQTEKRKTVNAIRFVQSDSDSDDSSSDDEEPSAVAPKKELSEAKKIESKDARGDVVLKKNAILESNVKAAIQGKTVNAIRFSDSDDSSSDDEEPAAVAPKKALNEMKKIESRELHDRMKACEEVVMKRRSEKAAIPGKQDILRKGRDSSSVSTEHPMAKKQTEKRKRGKRDHSPDVILLDEEEEPKKKKKIPKLEIQESIETSSMRQEGERATVRGETQGGRGEESSNEGLRQKGRAPGIPSNMDSSSSECMGPGLLMSGGPPLFAPPPPPPYLPSKGEAAGRYMTFLLDQAEMKGLNVDEIAMEAINTINRKMAEK